MAVPAPAVDAPHTYVGTHGQEPVTGTAGRSRPIFATRMGNAWQASEAFRTVQRLAKAAGVEGRISPHSLRHTFATVALDAGTTLHELQDSMGHADPAQPEGTTGHGTRWKSQQTTT
ncbi:tyrosine-type recombinase/integrase [Arthrobacter terrae]|uniref:tyrosine-type recombinase/integrase n=1 Tax=Arthrobacter terrae TaxID=2935737 RepID=UPI0035E41861